MKLSLHINLKNRQALILTLSFVLPALLMTGYFISRQMAPFGDSSLLTVDLGQQYIDFFAYFRHSLLNDPSGIFYTFQKAFGGEMVSTWTYYLLSPFNLLLLFFPDAHLTSGVFLITVLKYGAAGLSFAWLLTKTETQTNYATLGFSTSYALMGWMIANQLNLIWLDAVVILPLIILGLIKLLDTGRIRQYVFWLTALLIINYYMAYMVCLFVICFFVWEVTRRYTNWYVVYRQSRRFFFASLLAGGIAAVTLLPTWAALQQSKAQYTVTTWKFKFDYAPLDMLAKFFLGGFNFGQMPKGLPNLFVGSLVLLGVCSAILFQKQPRRLLIATITLTTFLAVSLCFDPLNLLWHGLQYPVWYPYRFSFVVCFWLIWLAANALSDSFVPTLRQILVLTLIGIAGAAYVGFNLNRFNFLNGQQFFFSIMFFIAAICLIALPNKRSRLYQLSFLIFAVAEMGCNAVISLNHISYVTQTDYQTYQQILTKEARAITTEDTDFYRLTPTFMRTKNDPLSGDYNGGSVFTSTLERPTPTFMGNIGSPDGDGFVAYTNGTVLTDALLNNRYLINQQPVAKLKNKPADVKLNQTPLLTVSTRPDLRSYQPIQTDGPITIYKNPNALPMGFIASSNSLRPIAAGTSPTQYQANLWAALTGNKKDQGLFSTEDFDRVVFHNVKEQTRLTGSILQKTDLLKPAQVTFYFTPKSNDSYYLTLGGTITNSKAKFKLNDQPLHQYPTYRNTIIMNLSNAQKNKPLKLQVTLKKPSLWLQNFVLYRFHNAQFASSVHALQTHPLKITRHNQSSLSGTIKAPANNRVMMTTIPYSPGWQVLVDGKRVRPRKVADMFIAVPLSKGSHQVSMRFQPPLLIPGLIITLVSLTICLLDYFIVKRWGIN